MNLLANPILIRAAFLLIAASAAFLIGLLLLRYLHKDLLADGVLPTQSFASGEALPLHAYNAVIQQLKQQKQELAEQNLSERRKAKANETLSAAILANISCGVVFVDSNGLVRQANAAARELLGFASPIGLHTNDILRSGMTRAENGEGKGRNEKVSEQTIGELLAPALAGECQIGGLLLDYLTPTGEKRLVNLTVAPVPSEGDVRSGTMLVLTDKTAIDARGHSGARPLDASWQTAIGLRESLTAISDNAQQLSICRHPETARHLAHEISQEAAQLKKTMNNFLTPTEASLSSAAGA